MPGHGIAKNEVAKQTEVFDTSVHRRDRRITVIARSVSDEAISIYPIILEGEIS